MISVFLISTIVFLAALTSASASVKINPSNHFFVDGNSRTRIFHGVNAVYKIAPWFPSTEGFDFKSSLSATDAKNLKSWGFNVVRLGIMWPGLEPGKRGDYNQEYLSNIQKIVELLAKENIYVVLDFHQDLFHRKFCGEGG